MRKTTTNVLITKFRDDDSLCPKFILLIDHKMRPAVLAVKEHSI